MLNVAMAALLQTVIVGIEPLPYEKAFEEASKSASKPLVVLVGADWCSACQTLKQASLPQVIKDGVMKEVAFTVIDADRDDIVGILTYPGCAVDASILERAPVEAPRQGVRDRLRLGEHLASLLLHQEEREREALHGLRPGDFVDRPIEPGPAADRDRGNDREHREAGQEAQELAHRGRGALQEALKIPRAPRLARLRPRWNA